MKLDELQAQHEILKHHFGAMVELQLHVSPSVDPTASRYYARVLNNYGALFVPVINSIKQSFYIELYGYIGAYYDKKTETVKVKLDKDVGSLGRALETEFKHNNAAKEMFDTFIISQQNNLCLLYDLRKALSHVDVFNKRNDEIILNYDNVKSILDGIADIIFGLGCKSGNNPRYYEDFNDSSRAVICVIDKLTVGKDAASVRERYNLARKKWMGEI